MLGDTLRREREKQGLTIKDIENETSIRSLYIEAIEKGDYDHLPSDVYTKGFIRNYAMVEPREDYAELYSQYIVDTDEDWNRKMRLAGEEGRAIIQEKLELIRTYMKESWNLDIDALRAAVQHRGKELQSLDLETLN